MKTVKRTLSLGLIAIMAAALPIPAAGASPEFSRTAEDWARLQDDIIEYDELADLIHEYNATVQNNNIDLNEFRKDYGDSNQKWADRYRELARDIQNDIEYPDPVADSAAYGGKLAGVISQEKQIESYLEQADDAVEDSTVWYLTYQSAEATLVSTAQSNMISYYQDQLQLKKAQLQQELQQENYQNALTRQSVGTATAVDVLNAQESLRSTEQTIIENQSGIETVREKLYVMLGWKHDDTPQIGELPQPDMEKIAAMDPAADKAQALENNYTLRINKRKLENAQSSDKKATLETTVRENEQCIGASLTASYQSVLSAKTAYELAVAQAELEQRNFQTASRSYELGTMSRLAYVTQKNTTEVAQVNVEIAELSLLQAMENYQWAVNGLASAS